MSSAQGKDFSNWNGALTKSSFSGLSFAFFKASESTNFIDSQFARSWALGKQVGIHRGAYHFFHPSVDPVAQAKFFVNEVTKNGLEPGDMLVADVEVTSGFFKIMLGLTTGPTMHKNNLPLKATKLSLVDASAKKFLDTVASLVPKENPVLVYSNLSVGSQLRSCTGYPLWIAYPSSTAPKDVFPWSKWTFWQWGMTGIDRDAFNGTSADLQAWLDGYLQPLRVLTELVTDGNMTMTQLSAQEQCQVSTILRQTAAHSHKGLFTHTMSAYIQSGNWNAPIPAGQHVWYPRLVG